MNTDNAARQATSKNTWVLLAGHVIVPASFFLFTYLTVPRMRCHIPSLEWEHVWYEITPYVFLLACVVSMLRFGMVALKESSHYWENGIALALAFSFNVFAFALVYYSFGLQVESDYLTSLPWDPNVVQGTQVETNGEWTELPVQVFEYRKTMVVEPLKYLAFSLSNAVPGGTGFDFKICSSASVFVIIQNLFGLGFTLIFTLFGAKVSRIFD